MDPRPSPRPRLLANLKAKSSEAKAKRASTRRAVAVIIKVTRVRLAATAVEAKAAKVVNVLDGTSTDVTRLAEVTTATVVVPVRRTGVSLVMNSPKPAPLVTQKAKPNLKSPSHRTNLRLNKRRRSRLKLRRLSPLSGSRPPRR